MQPGDSKVYCKQTDDLIAVALLELNLSKQPRYEIQRLVYMWSVKFYQSQCAVWAFSSASSQHILRVYTQLYLHGHTTFNEETSDQ